VRADAREVVNELLRVLSRVAWQDRQLLSIAAETPISLFVDDNARLRSCGVERQFPPDDLTASAGDLVQPAHVGALGFGRDRGQEALDSDEFVVEELTLVPATAGVRFRSVATGSLHSLALTEEGEVYVWTAILAGGPEVPTIIQGLRGNRVRRVAAGLDHSVALTDHGELFTWCDSGEA
jgi:alpha-tubulin suppressor-like RCC1 family protein